MSQTTFVNSVTLTDAGWFNDGDALIYPPTLSGTALTYAVGSFTGTYSGGTTAPTTAVRWVRVGTLITLASATAATFTSNAVTKTITGMPAALFPTATVRGVAITSDNGGGTVVATLTIGTDGVINFFSTAGGAAFTASGTTFLGTFTINYAM